ncbi:MAG: hypothetical protein H7Y42_09785, partial [Chitinophagaceae bacterium]|nr:hypothetical protein [Chitinophagaceae bacterium]
AVFRHLEIKDSPTLLNAMREALEEPAFVQRFVLYATEQQYNALLRFTDPMIAGFWEEITVALEKASLKRKAGTERERETERERGRPTTM